VGTFDVGGRNSFQAIHVDGAARIARIALEEGVRQFVHVSAIGADGAAGSEYGRSKFAGEQGVLAHMPHAVILRPSVMFGTEDQFFNRFATMAARSPVLPLVGAGTLFQPVYVDDVAEVAARAAAGKVPPGVYELGGPEALPFRELMDRMLGMIRRRRLVLGLPFWVGNLMARVFGVGQAVTLGLVRAPITRDQVASLRSHNRVGAGARGFEALGITPTALEAVLPDYLWRFRPGGQYAAIQESARNLRS
jgi:NADH dehydrogenase